jgi:integrase
MVTVDPYRIDGRITMIPRGRVWHFRFRLDGHRTQRSTREPLRRTARAEQVARDAYQLALAHSRGEEPDAPLSAVVQSWVETHRLIKSPAYITLMERFGTGHLGQLADLHLTEITTRAVEEERNRFLQTHAKTTANQWLTYLRVVCKWGIRRGMIRVMPWDVAEIKVKRRPKPLLPTSLVTTWFEEVEALTLREPAILQALELEVGLGLRGSEARFARWEWLDLEHGVYTPGDTKGGEAEPRPIPDWILPRLQARWKSSGWMVPSQRGRPVTAARVARVVDAACQATGIRRFTPHRLRATYATWLSEEGVPIQDIQHVLGHKDIRTTALYLGIDLGRVAAAQGRIAKRTGLTGRKSGAGGG